MKASRIMPPLLGLVLGFLGSAFLYPGPYTYGTENGASYRVNRLTGVQQYASGKGWVSRQEMLREAIDGTFAGMGEAFQQMGSPASHRP